MISTRLGVRGQRAFAPSFALAMVLSLVAVFLAPEVALAHEPGEPRSIDKQSVPDDAKNKGFDR